MIKITDKKNCCGCAACVQRCPKQCISLKEDGEGFLYPVVDESLCVGCGLCEKVCPIINRPEKLPVKEVLAVKNRNEDERMASSSGGVFVALAKKVIDQGGVVFGAVFDDNWEVRHTYAESMDGVRPMMGSKYVQSRIGDTFRQAEKFLKDGRKVLFTGSPCQITALHNYLRKDYPNLLSVDFLCHGVPSPGVWRRYLDEVLDCSARRAAAGKNTVLSSSLKSLPVITGIEFRDKTLHGWQKFSFVVRGASASKADKNSVLLSDIHYDNPFMKGFLRNVYLRPSCYRCKCKNGVSHSDLTIGDFWGVRQAMPDFNDDKGVGLVLVNTEKGKNVFASLDMEKRNTDIEAAKIANGGFCEYLKEHSSRELFFTNYQRTESLISVINQILKIPFSKQCIDKAKRDVRKIIKRLINK